MKIGIETESYHLSFQQRKMSVVEFIKKAYKIGAEGVQINITPGYNLHPRWGGLGVPTPEKLKNIRYEIDKYNLYSEIDTKSLDYNHLKDVIEIAEKINADVIRTYIVVDNSDALANANAIGNNIEVMHKKVVNDLKKIEPLLKKHRIKLALENHEDLTSKELCEIIKDVNSSWIGLLFDFGNSMMVLEEPVTAAEIMAPYIFSTHCKDNIIIKDEDSMSGYSVCGVPIGDGNVDIDAIYQILMDKTSLSRLNVEMSNPYCAPFSRPLPQHNNINEVLTGTFKVEEAPYALNKIKPKNYYTPHHEVNEKMIERMIKDQEIGLKKSFEYMKKLRNKYSA